MSYFKYAAFWYMAKTHLILWAAGLSFWVGFACKGAQSATLEATDRGTAAEESRTIEVRPELYQTVSTYAERLDESYE